MQITVTQLQYEKLCLPQLEVQFMNSVILPERDYFTFGSLLSQFHLSSVCRLSSVVCLSVTLVHPTQGVEPFGKISSPLCTLAIL